MLFTVTLDPESSPDEVGELLRSKFFADKDGELGGYNCFTWDLNVRSLEPVPVEPFECRDPHHWIRGERAFPQADKFNFVECRYYWDGDGTLVFLFRDGSQLINTDCKKDYGWEYRQPGWETCV